MSAYGPGAGEPVDAELLSTIGITDHALERFATRARPGPAASGRIEEILRDCMLLEGRVTYERPRWSRSRSQADWYVEVGRFLLCIVAWDDRYGRWAIRTVVNGPEWNSWQAALDRGWTRIPIPPVLIEPVPPRGLGLLAAWRAARDLRRSETGSLGRRRALSAVRRAHLDCEQERFEQEQAQREAQLTAYNQARERAYAAHRRRLGS